MCPPTSPREERQILAGYLHFHAALPGLVLRQPSGVQSARFTARSHSAVCPLIGCFTGGLWPGLGGTLALGHSLRWRVSATYGPAGALTEEE